MAQIQVALIGATGETGNSILEGLVGAGAFDITLIIRPQSLDKPATKALSERGFRILPIDASIDIDPALLSPFDVIISAVDNFGNKDQTRLAIAAKAAGVKRFVPCGFTTIAPPGGVMKLRDEKEEAYQEILKLKLGYTIIDVGYWYQISYPRVPSGKLDYSLIFVSPTMVIFGEGKAPNLLTDLEDIGKFVARIVIDPRTLNKKIFTWGDELSQVETLAIVEKVTGETVEREYRSHADVEKDVAEARAVFEKVHPSIQDATARALYMAEYWLSKYVREDNTRANALYLGYLDARELYPDFKPRSFEETIKQVFDGKARKLYEGRF